MRLEEASKYTCLFLTISFITDSIVCGVVLLLGERHVFFGLNWNLCRKWFHFIHFQLLPITMWSNYLVFLLDFVIENIRNRRGFMWLQLWFSCWYEYFGQIFRFFQQETKEKNNDDYVFEKFCSIWKFSFFQFFMQSWRTLISEQNSIYTQNFERFFRARKTKVEKNFNATFYEQYQLWGLCRMVLN